MTSATTIILIILTITNIILLISAYIDIKQDINLLKIKNGIDLDKLDQLVGYDNETVKNLEKFVGYNSNDKNDKLVQGNLSTLVEEWKLENKEETAAKVCKYDTFEDLNDFLDYVTNNNIKIIDVSSEKVRKVANLDRRIYNNQETVLITFDNGSVAIFKPNLYAKYNAK